MPPRTRDSNRAAQIPAADLVHRDFARPQADELQIGDATYIWTDEGWCYLATVVDACSRRLLGWSITDHLRTQLCLDALLAAVAARGGRRNLTDGIIFHTDHDPLNPGSTRLPRSGPRAGRCCITQSMGTVGDSTWVTFGHLLGRNYPLRPAGDDQPVAR